MPNKPDERLIILLPPDLLEEVRRAAEEADLSVSQIVRRAIRNELKSIAASKNELSAEELRELLKRNQVPLSSLLGSGLHHALQNDRVDPYTPRPSGKLSDLMGSQPESSGDHVKGKEVKAKRPAKGFKI
jgi:post-segregation antitoxin (ccd killing protein)